MSIVYRSVKGSKLTSDEVDGNFRYLDSSLNPDRIISLGTETISGNQRTYEGYKWQINGVEVDNIGNPIQLNFPSATVGFKRNDISVFKSDGTIERIAGIETDGDIVSPPDVPEGTLYFKTYSIDGDAFESEPEPTVIDGSIFKKKSENSSLKITATGEEQIINLSLAGQMHYIVTSSALISVAGFSPHLLNMGGNPLYPGQDLIFENQTGNPVTLINAHTIAPIKFNEGADIIVPNGGKIWFRINEEFAKIIMKSWSDADNTKLDKSTTPSSVYATDASGNQEMISKDSFQNALGFTPENLANKENTTLDTSTTKYPTNNLVKTNLDLKQNTLVSGTSIKTIEGQSILGSGNIDLNKADVGLSNVDNTSDVNKPISTATQTALDLKLDKVTITGEERVYTINPDGSQSTKPTSDFGTLKGNGTINRISKFTASGTIADSQIFDNGTNVGIGTSSPTSLLDIGIAGMSNSTNNQFLRVNAGGYNQASAASLDLFNWSNNFGQPLGWRLTSQTEGVGVSVGRGLTFNTVVTDGSNNISTSTERMRITSGGNVGIATTTPLARLDVKAQGALSTDIVFRVRNSTDTANLLSVDGRGTLSLGLQTIAPTGIEGAIYYNFADKKHYGFNGTTWNALY